MRTELQTKHNSKENRDVSTLPEHTQEIISIINNASEFTIDMRKRILESMEDYSGKKHIHIKIEQ